MRNVLKKSKQWLAYISEISTVLGVLKAYFEGTVPDPYSLYAGTVPAFNHFINYFQLFLIK